MHQEDSPSDNHTPRDRYPPANSWADQPRSDDPEEDKHEPKRDIPLWLERFYLVWDLVIMVLVSTSLLLILFDTLYLTGPFRDLLSAISPTLEQWGGWLHANFETIDLWFVAVFVFDVLMGWAFAIWDRRYHRWFFYPFVHWYDVLGCIPVGGLRLLRVLRVIGLLVRLQRTRLIDIRTWGIYRFFYKYYEIVLEEVSDRVIVRMLTDVQEGFLSKGNISRRVTDEVLLPRKQQLVDDVAHRIQRILGESYAEHREDINDWVSGLVHRAITENPTVRSLQRLPLGAQMVEAMDEAMADVASRLIREAVIGIRSPDFRSLIEELANRTIDRSVPVSASDYQALEQVLVEVLDVLKSEVKVQRWKERYH
ncbi:ion transporter [Kushneria konosiri]|uniref:ion transporter n=1 Tax=Kushneria konosiri TaxID=698828 RepID=UPI001D131D5C|nr:ion transporter [Kushneria konosiri]